MQTKFTANGPLRIPNKKEKHFFCYSRNEVVGCVTTTLVRQISSNNNSGANDAM